MDALEVEDFIERINVRSITFRELVEQARLVRVCPACRQLMSHIPLKGQWVDLCAKCGAMWFDRDERTNIERAQVGERSLAQVPERRRDVNVRRARGGRWKAFVSIAVGYALAAPGLVLENSFLSVLGLGALFVALLVAGAFWKMRFYSPGDDDRSSERHDGFTAIRVRRSADDPSRAEVVLMHPRHGDLVCASGTLADARSMAREIQDIVGPSVPFNDETTRAVGTSSTDS